MSKSRITLKILKNCKKKKIEKITKKIEKFERKFTKICDKGQGKIRKFSKNVIFLEMVFCKYLENSMS